MSSSNTFTVFASNALRTVLLDCLPAFDRANGVATVVDFGSTNHTLDAVRAGAVADLIIATASAIDELERAGKIVKGTRTDLATAGIGACVRSGQPRPDISSVDALKRTLLNASSVAYSKAGQSGIHFAKIIVQLGIASEVNAKARIGSGGLIGEIVLRGEAELGFQQVSEILAVKGVDPIGTLPDELQLMSLFSAGIGAQSPHVKSAQALIHELRSPHATTIMREAGLTPV